MQMPRSHTFIVCIRYGSFRAPLSAPTGAFRLVRVEIPKKWLLPRIAMEMHWSALGEQVTNSEISLGQQIEGGGDGGREEVTGGFRKGHFGFSPRFPSEDSMICHVQPHARFSFFFFFISIKPPTRKKKEIRIS